jgi:hypothetical protein
MVRCRERSHVPSEADLVPCKKRNSLPITSPPARNWISFAKTPSKEILGLNKRHLFLNVVRRLVEHGVSVSDLHKFLPARQFLSVPNKVTVEEFRKQASQLKNANGVPYDLRRRFLNDGELFNSEGKTWALSNQWSRYELPMLNELISKYPEAGISYKPSDEGDED